MPTPEDSPAPVTGLDPSGPEPGAVLSGEAPSAVVDGGLPSTPPAAAADDGAGAAGGGGPSDGGPPDEGGPAPAKRRARSWIVEAVAIFVVAVLVAVLLRTFVVQTYFIPSGSMEPTLKIGDRILVDKLSYHLHSVHRGDIVVFARPAAEDCAGPAVADLVKRVVGLPGESVSAVGGYVYVNGHKLAEPWLPSSVQGQTYAVQTGTPYDLVRPYKVPANDYYVMGDNRTGSCDSRYWGPVSRSLIVGKVVMRIWPVSGIKFF